MAAEALIILDLVATVVRNVGAKQRGKFKVYTDCKVTCDVLTLDRIKASQFALDGGGIISKITQLERESYIEFEHMHVKTRKDNEELGYAYEKKLVLEYDSIAKEARAKCSDNKVIDEVKTRGNVSLKHKRKYYDKKISEVIKKIDSEKCITEYFQDKHGENWCLT